MESKINYTIVGAFVLCLLAAIIVSTLWLSVGFSSVQYNKYLVYMDEAVTGLEVSSPVKYNGVDVGKVEAITIDKRNPRQVNLLLDIQEGTPITQGTIATLNTQGLTGIAYINLQGQTDDTHPLKKLPHENYPVIRSAPSLFLRLDAAVTQLSTNVDEVSRRLNAIMSPANQVALSKTLNHLQTLTQTLAQSNQAITETLQNSATASQVLNLQILPAFNQLLIQATQTSQTIKENPSLLIRGQAQPPLGPGEH